MGFLPGFGDKKRQHHVSLLRLIDTIGWLGGFKFSQALGHARQRLAQQGADYPTPHTSGVGKRVIAIPSQ